MKANELVTGDWVIDSTACHVRIDSIGKCVFCDDNDRYIGVYNPSECRSYNVHLCELSPIPITEEMLDRKRGHYCERNDTVKVWPFGKFKNGIDIFKRNDEDKFYFHNKMFPINYVHELQHALRLCGLDKDADSFEP